MKDIRLAVSEEEVEKVLGYLENLPLTANIELVNLDDLIQNDGMQRFILVTDEYIHSFPDWYNQSLPFVFPVLSLTKRNLLGLIFYHLGLIDDALSISEGAEIHHLIAGLISTSPSLDWLKPFSKDSYYGHNRAVLSFYFGTHDTSEVEYLFQRAIEEAQDIHQKAYSLKHYASFRADQQEAYELKLIQNVLEEDMLIPSARKALEVEEIKFQIQAFEQSNSGVPQALKDQLSATCTFYQEHECQLIEADLLSEMAWIAAQEGNFSEALSYINQSIKIYDEEELEVLSSELWIKKAGILHQWAKSGAPQFYQEAIQAFQQALKVVKQNESPYWFAEIHHRLGVLYAEMPEEQQKRAIWAAVSATSFQEALGFFTKESFPYEYAAVCHNYATALVSYPSAIKSDNIEKAIHYFNESLAIRTAEELPRERSITLLNYLEASWEASNINDVMERVRLKDMREKSQEILALTDDPEIISRVHQHLQSMDELDNELV